LPRGLLREPISALARAQVVALSRADLVPAEERREIRVRIEAHAPRAIWVELAHRPQSLVSSQGESRDITLLQGRRIAAFCGIGNPAGFRRTLHTCGADVVAWREFPDHYVYGESDRQSLAKWSDALDVELVLCTMKDFVKLRVDQLGQHHVRALAIQVEVLAGREELSSQLLSIASRAARE
jgi:tetraacyldisaccharide 4'-kinase